MPYSQPWTDPNTGAMYGSTYVQVAAAAPLGNSQLQLSVGRWVSQSAYSLGYQPLQRIDTQVAGAAFQSQFASQVAAAYVSLNAAFATLADAYIPSLATFSGVAAVVLGSLGPSLPIV